MASRQLRDAVDENETLDTAAKQLAEAFQNADLDQLRRAIDANDMEAMAAALGWSERSLRSLTEDIQSEATELAKTFPEVRELARQRRPR
jgi:hypothetical protein